MKRYEFFVNSLEKSKETMYNGGNK
jgi:hypothetical protein